MLLLVILRFNEFINQTIRTAIAADKKTFTLCIETFFQSLQGPKQQVYIVAVSIYYSYS